MLRRDSDTRRNALSVLIAHDAANDARCPESDFKIIDGHVNVPTGPGLGVTIDEKALKANTLLYEKAG